MAYFNMHLKITIPTAVSSNVSNNCAIILFSPMQSMLAGWRVGIMVDMGIARGTETKEVEFEMGTVCEEEMNTSPGGC